VKITAHAKTRADCVKKLRRALREFRVGGVMTNKYFLLNVLEHVDFLHGTVDTSFIASNPDLVRRDSITDYRGMKLLNFIANVTGK
jgi:pyruvate carboxylase